MLSCPLHALVTPFPRTFVIKGNANNGRNPPFSPFPALMTSFSGIAFINDETIGCMKKL